MHGLKRIATVAVFALALALVGCGEELICLTPLAEDEPLAVVLHHEDGSRDEVAVKHSLSDEQIEWFRAGSALNLLSKQAG